jgi:RAD50-interacting protein 1
LILIRQITQSEDHLNALRRDILDKSRSSLSATATFQSHYGDLTAQINNSWSAKYSQHEGLSQLESLDSRRRDLQRAKSYLQILLQVYDIRCRGLKMTSLINSENVYQEMSTDLQEAVTFYLKLRNLSTELRSRNEKAWDSMVHLTDYVAIMVKKLWRDLEDHVSTYFPFSIFDNVSDRDMIRVLRLLNWPSKFIESPTSLTLLTELKSAFSKTLVLEQHLYSMKRTVNSLEEPTPLLSFKVLVRDIDVHFRYHFEGNRATNNIEKVNDIIDDTEVSLNGSFKVF